MKMIVYLLLIFCSLLSAEQTLKSRFNLVFHITTENVDKIYKKLDASNSINYEQMCVDTIGNKLNLGLLIQKNYKNKVIFVNQNGNILKETNYVQYVFDVIGEPGQFRKIESQLYLGGYKDKAFLMYPFGEVHLANS